MLSLKKDWTQIPRLYNFAMDHGEYNKRKPHSMKITHLVLAHTDRTPIYTTSLTQRHLSLKARENAEHSSTENVLQTKN